MAFAFSALADVQQSGAGAWRGALGRGPGPALPAEETVARLREHVSAVRATRPGKPPEPPQ